MSKKRAVGKRALMAILLAGGFLHSDAPVYSLPESNSQESGSQIVERIIQNDSLSPATRTYRLLNLAGSLLKGGNYDEVIKSFSHRSRAVTFSMSPRMALMFKRSWVSQANQAAKLALSPGANKPDLPEENVALVREALSKALPLIDESTDPFFRLNMYLIASGRFRELGDIENAEKCDDAIQTYIRACELDPSAHADQLEAAASVLDSEAWAYVQVPISDRRPSSARDSIVEPQACSDESFEKSQKLRLRALALLDKLGPESHLRRKAHRDMALWYQALGKTEMARAQKEILFDMVGIHSDEILYPQSLGCGHLAWWKVASTLKMVGCGMG